MDMTNSVLVKYPPGDVLHFGTYNDKPIRWRVLDQQGDQRLLLAEEILDYQPYNKDYDNTYWQISSLRRWLIGTRQSLHYPGRVWPCVE